MVRLGFSFVCFGLVDFNVRKNEVNTGRQMKNVKKKTLRKNKPTGKKPSREKTGGKKT